eukprot:gene51856-58941_t
MLGEDPDDAFSLIPYEKGYSFLTNLENIVGGHQTLLKWIQSYIKQYARKTVTAFDVIASFAAFFPEHASKVDWEAWLDQPGMPPVDTRATLGTTKTAQVDSVVTTWTDKSGEGAKAADLADFHPTQVMYFLDQLLEHDSQLPVEKLKEMGALYGFDTSANAEIQMRWLQVRLRARDREAVPTAGEFLRRNGRGKYVKPVFNRLGDAQSGRDPCPAPSPPPFPQLGALLLARVYEQGAWRVEFAHVLADR